MLCLNFRAYRGCCFFSCAACVKRIWLLVYRPVELVTCDQVLIVRENLFRQKSTRWGHEPYIVVARVCFICSDRTINCCTASDEASEVRLVANLRVSSPPRFTTSPFISLSRARWRYSSLLLHFAASSRSRRGTEVRLDISIFSETTLRFTYPEDRSITDVMAR